MKEDKSNRGYFVLDDIDLSMIQNAFEAKIEAHNKFWEQYGITMEFLPHYLSQLFQAIATLNDYYKNTHPKYCESEFAEVEE